MPVRPREISDPDLQHHIVRALQVAYEIAQERHDPDVGDTPQTFGIHTFASGIHFLAQELRNVPCAACRPSNNSLEIRAGRCELRLHKLGRSENDDPWTSFPDNDGPASRMGPEDQLVLNLDLTDIEPLGWVIGHYGSPDEGLCAIRLQAPSRMADGGIARWLDVVTIFERGARGFGSDDPQPPDGSPIPPPPAPIPEPPLSLRPDGHEKTADHDAETK